MEMGHGFSGWIKFGEKILTPCWREQSRAASGLIFFYFFGSFSWETKFIRSIGRKGNDFL